MTEKEPAGGDDDTGACGKPTALTPPGPKNSVMVSREVGPHGPYNSQFIEVFKSLSAALHFAGAVRREVPCSQPGADGASTTWTKSARPYSYDVSVKGAVSARAIVDLIPVRNVVYFNDDVSVGSSVNAKAHNDQTEKMVETVDGLA